MTDTSGEQEQPQEPAEPSGVGLTYSQTPQGVWDVERAQYELKAAAELHNRGLARQRQAHELEEARKDNQQRRRQEMLLFITIVSIIVVGLVVGFVVSTQAENDTTRTFGQGIVTLLLGTIAGGLAGYFTGRSGK